MGKTNILQEPDQKICTQPPDNNNSLYDDDQTQRLFYAIYSQYKQDVQPLQTQKQQETQQTYEEEFIHCLDFKDPKKKVEILQKQAQEKQLHLLEFFSRKKIQQDLFIYLFVLLIRKLNDDDFAALYKDKKAIKILKFITENKEKLPTQVRQAVKRFLDLFESRILYYPQANLFYKKLITVAQKLSKVYQYKGQRYNVEHSSNQHNRIYIHLVKEAQCRPYRKGTYYIRELRKDILIPLTQYMAQYPKLLQDHRWVQIINTIHRKIQMQNTNELKPQFLEFLKFQKKIDYTKQIHSEKFQKKYCLGCSKFFCVNWNIFQQTLQQVTLAMGGKVLDILSTKTNKQKKKGIIKKIAKEICALLNSGGGVLLFDCEAIFSSVIPHGQVLSHAQRQQIARIIKNQVIKNICPKLELGTDIVLNFMKLMRYPIYKLEQYDQIQLSNTSFINDLYVMRMIARPKANTSYTFQDEGKLYKAVRHGHIADTLMQSQEVKIKSTLQIQSQMQEPSVIESHSKFDHNVCHRSQYSLQAQQWSIDNSNKNRDQFYQILQQQSAQI